MCGEDIIKNLLRKNNNIIGFPKTDPDGDIEFGGNKFVFLEKEMEET
jgi:hypothetical protein